MEAGGWKAFFCWWKQQRYQRRNILCGEITAPQISHGSVVEMYSRGDVVLWVLVVCLVDVLQNHPPHTCDRYTSFGYGYRDFFEFQHGNFSPNQVFYLEFYVKTSSDAHVLLKPDVGDERGYEVVIGGGSNTFSQIRLLEPDAKKTMITQKTENFLSEQDYKLFWIAIDRLGIISVGRGDDEVFINWRFDHPLPVKYFSFGSWTNMKADWRFGCKSHGGSDVIHEEGVLTPLKKLKRDLFSLYDPNALPVEKNAHLEVKINFQVNNVQLNERRGEFIIYGTGDLKWRDEKMKWKPENYGGIENIFVPPFQIWTPSLRVLNALAVDKSPLFDLTTSGVVVKYDGSVFWRPPFKSVSHCKVDLKFWPVDAHNCTVLFGFWMEPDNLVLSMMDEYDTLPELRTESEWKIMKVVPFNTHHPDEGENYGVLYVEVQRANGLQEIMVSVPYGAAIAMTLVSFWMPLHSPLKLHLMFSSAVVLLLIFFAAGGLVPAMTDGVPIIINLYSWTLIVTCVPILLYVALKNIELYADVPPWLSKLLRNSTLTLIFCLPDLNETNVDYSNLNEEENKQNKDRLSSLRLVVVIDRLSFLGYLLAIILLCLLF